MRYLVNLSCTPDQFGDLKFGLLKRYKHEASFKDGTFSATLYSVQAVRAIGAFFGLTEVPVQKKARI